MNPTRQNFGGTSFNQGESHDTSYQSLNFTLTESNITQQHQTNGNNIPKSRGLDTHRITATFLPIEAQK